MSNSGNFGPRIPLSVQNRQLAKAAHENASYESFRPNVIHQVQYKDMDNTRATVSPEYRIRRYPDAKLDVKHTSNQIIDAIHKLEYNGVILPIEAALLTVVFPGKYREVEPMQAEILTQLSPSEKEMVALFVENQLKAENEWGAGLGRGNAKTRPNNVGG